MGMMGVYAVTEKQMKDWTDICTAYAKKIGAELLFVNETSMGIEKGGEFRHIYIDELAEILKV